MSVNVQGRMLRHTAHHHGPGLPDVASLLLAASLGYSPPAGAELPKINPDGLTTSAVCGECHQAIHAVWQGSLHSNSWSNAIFQAGYRRAQETHGQEGAKVCLSCHAPTVRHTKDYDVKQPITAEGVTTRRLGLAT